MRIFFKTGSTVTEITKPLNKYKGDDYVLSMTNADAIYIATDFPLNHFYVKLGTTKNIIASDLKVENWNGNGWQEVVHLNDYTDAFTQSGFIDFTPDRNSSWVISSSNIEGQTVTDLESITVYDQYWTKLTVNNSLTPSINLAWVGNLFSDDADLFSEFSLFNDSNFLTGFETGKTSWEEQHVKAGELIVQDLKKKRVIVGKEQILDRDVLLPASVCKVAEIIFNAFGKDYADQKTSANDEYNKRIDLPQYSVDLNNNAVKEASEVSYREGWLSR